MKFLISKKLIDNKSLYASVVWMVSLLIIAIALNMGVKIIDFGVSPQDWVNSIMGNEEEFIDPLGLSDLLLSLHTDLFGLILVFVLTSALMMRTSHSQRFKTITMTLGVSSLLAYASGVIASLWFGAFCITIGWGGFGVFHLLMMGLLLNILVLLIRKKF
jgi:hypothetical protein